MGALVNELQIQKLLKDMKGQVYALVNPDLAALDEFTKSLYLRLLCTVVQYKCEPSAMQTLYLNRIVKGMSAEEPLEEYMKKGLSIAVEDIRDFVDYMNGKPARFYFALDAAVLTALGSHASAGCEYPAELLEVLGISRQELQCITLIAKSIITQQSSFFDEARPLMRDALTEANFIPYVGNFFAGAILDTPDAKAFYSPSKELSVNIQYPTEYTAGSVRFSNLQINLLKTWTFNCCKEVVFENCSFRQGAKKSALSFDCCEKVRFINCCFSDFTGYTIVAATVVKKEFSFINCEFNNCRALNREDIYEGYYKDYDGREGIVIHACSISPGDVVLIDGCQFKHCTGFDGCWHVISNALCIVQNSQFKNCGTIDSLGRLKENYGLVEYSSINGSSQGSNNVVIGSGPVPNGGAVDPKLLDGF